MDIAMSLLNTPYAPEIRPKGILSAISHEHDWLARHVELRIPKAASFVPQAGNFGLWAVTGHGIYR